jgi:hypothetical protein
LQDSASNGFASRTLDKAHAYHNEEKQKNFTKGHFRTT